MKKIILTLALVFASIAANAQFGVIGGWTSSRTGAEGSVFKRENLKSVSLYHVGVAYKVDMGALFTIQPALVYQAKGTLVEDSLGSLSSRGGFLELELGMQLGLDLLAFRPYFLFEPFLGYQVVSEGENLKALNSFTLKDMNTQLNNAKNKFEVGFGIGAGIEILNHLQLSFQWFMNVGKLYDANKLNADIMGAHRFTHRRDRKGRHDSYAILEAGCKIAQIAFFRPHAVHVEDHRRLPAAPARILRKTADRANRSVGMLQAKESSYPERAYRTVRIGSRAKIRTPGRDEIPPKRRFAVRYGSIAAELRANEFHVAKRIYADRKIPELRVPGQKPGEPPRHSPVARMEEPEPSGHGKNAACETERRKRLEETLAHAERRKPARGAPLEQPDVAHAGKKNLAGFHDIARVRRFHAPRLEFLRPAERGAPGLGLFHVDVAEGILPDCARKFARQWHLVRRYDVCVQCQFHRCAFAVRLAERTVTGRSCRASRSLWLRGPRVFRAGCAEAEPIRDSARARAQCCVRPR